MMDDKNFFALKNVDIVINVGGMLLCVTQVIFSRLPFSMPPHSHGEGIYELHYISGGEGRLIAMGKTYKLCAGDIYMTGPRVVHEQLINPASPTVEFCVSFDVLPHRNICEGDAAAIRRAFLDTSFWFGKDTKTMPSVIKKIGACLKARRIGYIESIKLELSRIVLNLAALYSENAPSCEEIRQISIDNNRRQMIDNMFLWYHRNLTLDELAASMKLSKRQTEREIKKYFGTTFGKKLTQAKLNAAAKLLCSGSDSIISIAEQVGINSGGYFCSLFKQQFKITASEYRQRSTDTAIAAML